MEAERKRLRVDVTGTASKESCCAGFSPASVIVIGMTFDATNLEDLTVRCCKPWSEDAGDHSRVRN